MSPKHCQENLPTGLSARPATFSNLVMYAGGKISQITRTVEPTSGYAVRKFSRNIIPRIHYFVIKAKKAICLLLVPGHGVEQSYEILVVCKGIEG